MVLSLPVDVQDADLPIAYEYERGVIHSTLPAPDPKAIAAAAEELSRSKRPLILAGRGAVVAKAKQSLVSLADEVGALLATSAFAHGLFADCPWSLGISGGFASPAALELIPQSDFILGFGGQLYALDHPKGHFNWQGDKGSCRLTWMRHGSAPIVGSTTQSLEMRGLLRRRCVPSYDSARAHQLGQQGGATRVFRSGSLRAERMILFTTTLPPAITSIRGLDKGPRCYSAAGARCRQRLGAFHGVATPVFSRS